MTEDLHIPVELMMEHAGLNLARAVPPGKKVLVVAGSGNNGAGGLTCARRLLSWGYEIDVFLPKGIKKLREVAMKQFLRLTSIADIDVFTDSSAVDLDSYNCTIDAYIGYGFTGKPDTTSALVFDLLQNSENLICLDGPSGIDMTTGNDFSKLKPNVTCTLAFPKKGHLTKELGVYFLVDIGVPKNVIERIVGESEVIDEVYRRFKFNSIVKIRRIKEGYWGLDNTELV